MRIILGKSSGTNSSANNCNNTADFGSVDSVTAPGATVATNRIISNRTSSPPTGVAAYSAHNSLSTHFLENFNPKATQNRKRKNSGLADGLDTKKPAILFHQKQPLKFAAATNMVSSTAKTKLRANGGAATAETTLCVATSASNFLGSLSQTASRTSGRNEEDLLVPRVRSPCPSVSSGNEPHQNNCDPNDPAAEDEVQDPALQESVSSLTVANISQTNFLSSSLSQRKISQQQYSVQSSYSSSSVTHSRSNNTAGTKECQPTVVTRKDKEFANLIKKHLKFDIVEMDGDGNCLFRAVALQVFGDVSMHNEVRRRCVEFMAKNEEHYSQFLTDEESFSDYIQRKSMDGVHGNHVEIQVISELYNRPVEVWKPENGVKPINIFHTEYKTSDHPIRLSYHDGNHYNAIIDPFCPTAGLGLGLPGLQPGLADEMQLKEALIDSDRLELDRLYVEKAIRDSEECYMDQFYKEKAMALSDLEQTDLELEQAIIQSSLEACNNVKQSRRSSSRESLSNSHGSLTRNRMQSYTDNFYSETTSTSRRSTNDEFHRLSDADVSGSSSSRSTINPSSSIAAASYAESRFDNPVTDDGAIGPHNVDALSASEYPDSVTELVMNGFELTRVLRAYELVGDNFDDLLSFLMNS